MYKKIIALLFFSCCNCGEKQLLMKEENEKSISPESSLEKVKRLAPESFLENVNSRTKESSLENAEGISDDGFLWLRNKLVADLPGWFTPEQIEEHCENRKLFKKYQAANLHPSVVNSLEKKNNLDLLSNFNITTYKQKYSHISNSEFAKRETALTMIKNPKEGLESLPEEIRNAEVKILVVGSAGEGKTSMIDALCGRDIVETDCNIECKRNFFQLT